ncbi:M15 family metallopeptidase [Pengzhenrongella phosphoraccumulans]|uniref:M15 family metallopeptidase n=1 Tax=Pengzhenrongella phosphoraccumulans TaxID=3114394 RepID=UPI00388E5040
MIARSLISAALVVSFTAISYKEAAPSAEAVAVPAGPTVVEALLAAPVDVAVPVKLLAGLTKNAERASRSLARDPVPGCDGIASGAGENGRVPASELCDLWQHPYQDRADAVVSLDALNDSFKARFGTDMCLSSAYRDREEQAALRAKKGSIAAPAGQSNHGWGLAVDFCPSVYTGQAGQWMADVGPVFGWSNPAWARRGGGGSFEPWHWEFTAAVAEKDGTGGRK